MHLGGIKVLVVFTEKNGKAATESCLVGKFCEMLNVCRQEKMLYLAEFMVHAVEVDIQFAHKQAQWPVAGVEPYCLTDVVFHRVRVIVILDYAERLLCTAIKTVGA